MKIYDRFRRFAEWVGYRAKPTNDDQVQTEQESRDWLSRCEVGDPAYVLDGVHWRFDQADNLGRRFLVERSVVVEIQTAFAGQDGVYRAVKRLRRQGC